MMRVKAEGGAAVAEECLVLCRKIRLDQLIRKIGILQLHAAFACIGMDDLTINPAHNCRQRGLVICKAFRLRQIAGKEHPDGHPDHDQSGKSESGQFEQQAGTPFLAKPRDRHRGIARQAKAEIFDKGGGAGLGH